MLLDRASYGAGLPMLAVAPTFCGIRAVRQHLTAEGWLAHAFTVVTIHDDDLGPGRHYSPPDGPGADEKYHLQTVLSNVRRDLVAKGGSPEAVRLLDKLFRFTPQETKTMADKLSKKTTAAKAAPAKDSKPAKGKAGNPEALKKAREASEGARAAKQEELLKDKRKITATEKGKAKIAKAGKDDKLSRIVAAKTVGGAMALDDVKFADISYAERVDLITLG